MSNISNVWLFFLAAFAFAQFVLLLTATVTFLSCFALFAVAAVVAILIQLGLTIKSYHN